MTVTPDNDSNNLQRRLTKVLTSEDQAEKLQRQVTQHSRGMAVAGEHVMELEWEEWDDSISFTQHCLAGSLAGISEHILLYPFDTLKTFLQSQCADCPKAIHALSNTKQEALTVVQQPNSQGMLGTLRQLHAATDRPFGRLWRGAQVMAIGCIPAHALYFSSYEAIKALFLQKQELQQQNLGWVGSSVAGATAALSHDLVMTPVDTIKQRLQLGHYSGMSDAVTTMARTEGLGGFYRALPVTVCTNLPYGVVMVSTNEYLRDYLMHHYNSRTLDVKTTMLAASGAGAVAAAVTTPLDRVKTRLQTQGLGVVMCDGVGACPKLNTPKYQGLGDAFWSIVREEGMRGLFRGMVPRLLTHTPAAAISWTTYETAKMWLSSS